MMAGRQYFLPPFAYAEKFWFLLWLWEIAPKAQRILVPSPLFDLQQILALPFCTLKKNWPPLLRKPQRLTFFPRSMVHFSKTQGILPPGDIFETSN